MMKKLIRCSNGFWAGDFVIMNENCSFSIGDYITAILIKEPYDSDETVTDYRKENCPVINYHFLITESCDAIEHEVIFQLAVCKLTSFLNTHLKIGVPNILKMVLYRHGPFSWFSFMVNSESLYPEVNV